MERDLWTQIIAAIKALPPRSPRNSCYSSNNVLAVILWAALHDRPISWACKRANWPFQAWRRKLPNQSTMSRRMRDELLVDDLNRVIEKIQHTLPRARLLLTDGKPYKPENQTNDKEAKIRWASGRCAKGYKLHVVIDQGHRLLGWALHPMNHGETTACAKIIEKFPKQDRKKILVGDAGYSSNQLHAMSASRNIRLIAPRIKPGTGLGNRKHHQDRIASVRLTEDRGGWMWPMLRARRSGVERYFSGLVTSCVGLVIFRVGFEACVERGYGSAPNSPSTQQES